MVLLATMCNVSWSRKFNMADNTRRIMVAVRSLCYYGMLPFEFSIRFMRYVRHCHWQAFWACDSAFETEPVIYSACDCMDGLFRSSQQRTAEDIHLFWVKSTKCCLGPTRNGNVLSECNRVSNVIMTFRMKLRRSLITIIVLGNLSMLYVADALMGGFYQGLGGLSPPWASPVFWWSMTPI
jgi:hypothetical protein